MRLEIIFFILFSVIYSCPNEPSDILLIIKATYYLSESQWQLAKSVGQRIGSSLNIGRTKSTSQMAVYLYDNLNAPKGVIENGAYGRNSDLQVALEKINQLPCGSWCGEMTQKNDVEQIAVILSKQVFTRPAKVLIISADYIDTYGLQPLITTTSNVMIQQVQIPQIENVIAYNQQPGYYNYYRAYYDNYRRYAGRIEQLYPYMHVEIPTDQYPQYYNYDYSNWASGVCYNLLGCQQCLATPQKLEISSNIDSASETVNSGDSKSSGTTAIKPSKLQIVEASTLKPNLESLGSTEDADYEYEITADPPGLKINKTPLLDEVQEKSVKDEYELQ